MSEAIRVRQLVKDYVDGDRTLHVLCGVDLKATAGEIVSVTGTSGSGKSTLLHLLGGLDRPTSGTVQLAGRELSKLSEGELARVRASTIGIVFQFYHLLPEFTALENIVIAQLIFGRGRAEARKRAHVALAEVGLEDRVNHYPTRMSGGEQQRVAIARALVNGPAIILADEPTGNLDAETGEAITNLLWDRVRERNCTMVMVTHEPLIAQRADRHYRLVKGRLDKLP